MKRMNTIMNKTKAARRCGGLVVAATAGALAVSACGSHQAHPGDASSDLDRVVRGTVTAVAFERPDGIEQTKLTVDVASTPLGPPAREVVVREDGGFARAADIEAENHDKFPNVSATAKADDWVDMPFEGSRHPEVGDEVLLFRHNDPNPGRDGQFQEVGSVYGRFTRTDDGRYVRAGDDPRKQLSLRLADVLEAIATHG